MRGIRDLCGYYLDSRIIPIANALSIRSHELCQDGRRCTMEPEKNSDVVINCLQHAIDDAQSTIRAYDTKAEILGDTANCRFRDH